MIALNAGVLESLNHSALASSGLANRAIAYLAGANLVKGIPIMGLLWYVWHKHPDARNARRLIVMALAGCVLALLVARVLNNTIVQPRPFASTDIHLQPLAGLTRVEDKDLVDQNSFPSDHATLFFGLATAIFLLSRRAGLLTFFYVALLIALPRMYLGLHYPTDILAGTLLGTGCVLLAIRRPATAFYVRRCEPHVLAHPALFMAAMFLLCMEMTVMFEDVRMVLKIAAKSLH